MMPNSAKESPRSTGRTRQSRRRAPVACQSCHARKVRCSLPQTGNPCTNCSLDELSCVPRESRRSKRGLPYNLSTVSSSSNNESAIQSPPLGDGRFPPGPERLVAFKDLSVPSGPSPTAPAVGDTGDSIENSYRPFNEHFSHHHGGDTGASQLDGDATEKCCSPLYGDPRGVGLVVGICEPEPREKSGHFLIPRIEPTHMDQDTIEYLRRKGVFDFPTPAVCEMMIRTYFYYVHPFFPVIDAHSFLDTFENKRNEVSVHLLWSMFLAAANFADDSTLRAANFSSRKEMKRAMYNRAKVALYDAEYERRKITLIQAVLLTGFWYSDTEDRTGPWHWNGIAISLCQTIGLHRHPDTGQKRSKAMSASDSSIWRQVWWSCFYREAWFSAGMGRPMRINLADCSTQMPHVSDSNNLLAGIPECIRKKYLPEGTKDLSKLWTDLLTLTVSLAKILSWQNRADRTRPSRAELQQMDDAIRQYCFRKDHAIVQGHSHVVSLHMYHLELYLDSVLLTLYRPFLFDRTEMNPDLSADEWTSTVRRRTKDAATNINRILGNMINADMIGNTQAMVCIALVPALQIHLLDATSQKQMVQRMGRHNLEFCMMIIEELKSVYFGAEILARMFTKAKNWINHRTFAPATAPREYMLQSSSDSTIGSIPDLPNNARQNDVEILDAFATMLSPFGPVSAGGSFDDDDRFQERSLRTFWPVGHTLRGSIDITDTTLATELTKFYDTYINGNALTKRSGGCNQGDCPDFSAAFDFYEQHYVSAVNCSDINYWIYWGRWNDCGQCGRVSTNKDGCFDFTSCGRKQSICVDTGKSRAHRIWKDNGHKSCYRTKRDYLLPACPPIASSDISHPIEQVACTW
ncbi:hypothetical protein DPV78_009079 [Talaromyces pinophilus]|nr:hypothetical protein DPV78_009079 [Talaromyces pinophilus]